MSAANIPFLIDLHGKDADATRLIFADFLEDNGEAERAGYIRDRSTLVRLSGNVGRTEAEREERWQATLRVGKVIVDINEKGRDAWCGQIRGKLDFDQYGFAYSWTGDIEDWFTHGRELVTLQPVRTVIASDVLPVPFSNHSHNLTNMMLVEWLREESAGWYGYCRPIIQKQHDMHRLADYLTVYDLLPQIRFDARRVYPITFGESKFYPDRDIASQAFIRALYRWALAAHLPPTDPFMLSLGRIKVMRVRIR